MAEYRFRRLTSLADVAPLRAARVASLTALPELFVELNVRQSDVYGIELDGTESDGVIGYLTAREKTLTELYVVPEYEAHASAILTSAAASLGLTKAWACTFDPLGLAACSSGSRPFTTLGLSFRALHEVALPVPAPLPSERLASATDVERVTEANHPEVFDDPADIALWVANGWVTLFEFPVDIVGFGLCTPAGPETLACDVGIRVCEPYQRRGLGAWIVQRMAARARDQGLVPTAGCDVGNEASRRTLERAGFVADHRLLEFRLGTQAGAQIPAARPRT